MGARWEGVIEVQLLRVGVFLHCWNVGLVGERPGLEDWIAGELAVGREVERRLCGFLYRPVAYDVVDYVRLW